MSHPPTRIHQIISTIASHGLWLLQVSCASVPLQLSSNAVAGNSSGASNTTPTTTASEKWELMIWMCCQKCVFVPKSDYSMPGNSRRHHIAPLPAPPRSMLWAEMASKPVCLKMGSGKRKKSGRTKPAYANIATRPCFTSASLHQGRFSGKSSQKFNGSLATTSEYIKDILYTNTYT